MNTPEVIYIGKTVWSEEPIIDSYPYFSEQAVKDVLKQVVNDANTLISCAKQSVVFTNKLDADKYIPHIIDLLLKGGDNA